MIGDEALPRSLDIENRRQTERLGWECYRHKEEEQKPFLHGLPWEAIHVQNDYENYRMNRAIQ